jgi:flavin reductase (DIM6/NTAB) family NADH-FMN oxidoreductase RutF
MDPKVRQKTLRLISNGVYVLTARAGERLGAATVTWVSQISFRPPLIMAAVRRESNVFQCLAESGSAVLHIVGDDQPEIAKRFFYPTRAEEGKLNGEPYAAGQTQAPVLERLPAHVECRVGRVIDAGGDHAMVILEAVEAECDEAVQPLTIAQTPWHYGG